jgi:hypothetical protein
MPDTSGPGPTALQAPTTWVYDFDPGTGVARATFNGEIAYTTGPVGAVTSWNGRGGAVTMTTADITGAGGAPIASPTFTGLVTPGTSGIKGVVDGSAGAAGSIGEMLTASLGSTPLTSNVVASCGSLVLTPGDWDIDGTVTFTGSAATASGLTVGLNTASTAFGALTQSFFSAGGNFGGTSLMMPTIRSNSTTSTTIYAIVQAGFSSGTWSISAGQIRARRMR